MIEAFVRRKVTTSMVFLGMVLVGIISLLRLPVQLLPNIEFPTLTIITPYPSASPAEVEKLVTRRIEEAAASVTGVRELRSESIEGLSLVTARFSWGSSMDFALIETKEKVDMAKGSLPEEAEKSIVVKFDPAGEPFMMYVVKARGDFKKLRRTLERDIIPLLERTDGVAMVEAYGGFRRQINVDADSGAMAARGVTFEDMVQAISSANYNFPAGSIETGAKEYEVRTIGEFKSPDDINSVVVGHNESGVPVYLSQIARVEDGWKDQKSVIRFDGDEAVGLFITREPGKNTIETSRNVRARFEELSKKFQNEISFYEVFNQANFISDSVANVRNAGILGALCTIFVLLLFLPDIRAAFIVASSIPISAVCTFALMYAKGTSLNAMSLGGLALGIGMTVDSAIVVMEAIADARAKKPHLKGEQVISLVLKAVEEVRTPVIASILTTLVVFLPIIFLSGIAGALFGELALTISFSLISTLATSLLLVPMLAALPREKQSTSLKFSHLHLAAYTHTARVLSAINSFYTTLLGRALVEKRRLYVFACGITLSGIILTLALPRELLPKIDNGEFSIELQAPRGTPLEETLKLTESVEAAARTNRHVSHVLSKTGCDVEDSISERLSGKMRDYALIRVVLKNSFRPHISEIIEDIRNSIHLNKDVQIDFHLKEDIIQSVLASKSAPITIEISGRDFEDLKNAGERLKEALQKVQGIRTIASTLDEGNPEIRLAVDRAKGFAHGLSIASVASTLRSAVAGDIATAFREGDDETDVRVRLRKDARNDLRALSSLFVKSAHGAMLEIGKFSEFLHSLGPVRVSRINQSRVNIITAQIDDSKSAALSQITRAIASLEENSRVEAHLAGEYTEIEKTLPEMMFALALAVVLVYMVLASQFQSFTLPLLVMASIPLTLVGSSGALFLAGKSLNINSLIGMILLSGTVVNNAIVLVDFIAQHIKQGTDIRTAVTRSVERRMRPILMTTLTTILGMLPLALGIGSGAELQQPLAIATIGGLLCSTVLTLVFIPALFFHTTRKGAHA